MPEMKNNMKKDYMTPETAVLSLAAESVIADSKNFAIPAFLDGEFKF